MTALRQARQFVAIAPSEALGDALGFAALCLLIVAAFSLPALL